VFDWLTHQISGSPWTYLVVFAACAGDVILPLIPSETVVITAGVAAARNGLSVWLLIPAATVGAVVGDNLVYWLGRSVGDPVVRRLARGETSQQRLRWAERAIARHGAVIIIASRFIPGGRTVSMLAAGTLELRYRTFLIADVAAALAWALYATLLGYLGGETFRRHAWQAIVLALALAFAVSLVIELWRRFQRARGRDLLGDPLHQG